MCRWGTYKIIEINGRFWPVDACIADQVQILISRGVKAFGCCCGHGKMPDIDRIFHHFRSEVMICADSAPLAKSLGLECSRVYEKTSWGKTANYVNVRLLSRFDPDGNY